MLYLTIFLWFISFIIGTAILRVFIFTDYKTFIADEFISLFLGAIIGWMIIIITILGLIIKILLLIVTSLLEDITNLFERLFY